MVIPHMGDGALVSPYLFHNEYPSLVDYLKLPTWFGHFEFKGFVVTGYNITMPTGPDIIDYSGPTIFSGHFHKRQSSGKVHYIGSIFPMDFSDAGQSDRGMMVFDHATETRTYVDWKDCPKYAKVRLTDILEEGATVHSGARIKCVMDVPISFEESQYLRNAFMEKFELREFSMEESQDLSDALTGTAVDLTVDDNGEIKLDSVDDLVIQMINGIDTPHIETAMLTQIYQQLQV
jgi:DNA repair exonuclease SbcCD nuclease subunit